MKQPSKTHLPADPAKRGVRRPTRRAAAAPEQSATRDILAAGASADSAQRRKPAVKKRTPRTAKSHARPRRKRVRIGEALRKIGYDEYTIAQNYADTTARLKAKSDKSGNIEKLLIDVLKECSRLIEPLRPAETAINNSRVAGTAIHVQLVHNVPRPVRGELSAAGAAPIILDVPSTVNALPSAEEPQLAPDMPTDSALALKSDLS